MSDPSPAPGVTVPRTLGATATLIGEYRWIENALYGVLGRWVTDVAIPAVQVHLDGQSLRHAWHAELWAERLPVLAGIDGDRLTAPGAPAAAVLALLEGEAPSWSDGLAEVDRSDGPPPVLARLAALYRVVLPRLVTSYHLHLEAANAVSEAPVARALRLILNDEVDDWLAGERLVERLMTRPHDVAVVHHFVQQLESAVVAAGARSGLVQLGKAMSAG